MADRLKLHLEYNEMYDSIYFWIVRLIGFCRIKVSGAQVVDKSAFCTSYGCFVILLEVISLTIILYKGVIKEQTVLVEEGVICVQIFVMLLCILIEFTFGNSNCTDLIDRFVNIDLLLGVNDTVLMRKRVKTAHYFTIKINIVLQVVIISIFNFMFDVSVATLVAGSVLLTLAIGVIFDACHAYICFAFLSMRIKYLNLAIMKYSNMDPEYMPDVFLFDGIFWKNSYNDLVTFHTRAGVTSYIEAFKQIFEQIRCLERCYRLVVFLATGAILTGSLTVVQAVILQESKEINIARKFIVSAWFVIPLVHLTLFSLLYDGLLRLLEQTKVICTYIQLKPTNSDDVFKLTKRVYDMVRAQEPRMSIYDIYIFDTGFMLKLAASIFVYITVQVQFALYNRKYGIVNVISPPVV